VALSRVSSVARWQRARGVIEFDRVDEGERTISRPDGTVVGVGAGDGVVGERAGGKAERRDVFFSARQGVPICEHEEFLVGVVEWAECDPVKASEKLGSSSPPVISVSRRRARG